MALIRMKVIGLMFSSATDADLLTPVDPLMSECLIYQLKLGQTMVRILIAPQSAPISYGYLQVGHLDSQKPVAIRLSGGSIIEEHCYFENNDGKVTLHAMPDSVTVSLCCCSVPFTLRFNVL